MDLLPADRQNDCNNKLDNASSDSPRVAAQQAVISDAVRAGTMWQATHTGGKYAR